MLTWCLRVFCLAATVFVSSGAFAAVSVEATDPYAGESGFDWYTGCGGDGVFTISVETPPASDLLVPFTLSGSATHGQDYTALSNNWVVIGAGQTSATVTIEPIDDFFDEATFERVTLTIMGSDSSAWVIIADDDPSSPFFSTPVVSVDAVRGGFRGWCDRALQLRNGLRTSRVRPGGALHAVGIGLQRSGLR